MSRHRFSFFAFLTILGIATAGSSTSERKEDPSFSAYERAARGEEIGLVCSDLRFGDKALACSSNQHSGLLAVASEALWPVNGPVTSGFGYRRSPFHRYRAADFHPGIDIAARRGDPIRVIADGIVAFAGFQRGYGRMIVIDHGFGMTSVYGHASKIFVSEGLWVEKGMFIGLVGSSGAVTGPHLHYEFRLARVPFDPESLYQGGVL